MAINFRKLKSQIKSFKPEVKDGYIFIATDEQKNNGLFSIAKCGSKRGLLSALSVMKTSNVNLLYNNQVAYWLPQCNTV